MAGGAFTYFKAVSVDFDGILADGLVAPYMLRSARRAPGGSW
jgi:hypothetical protein